MGSFLWFRNSKAFCERPFTVQPQQPEKDDQNVAAAPTVEKFMRAPMATFTLSASFDVWASQG